jgi:hypothetical protein
VPRKPPGNYPELYFADLRRSLRDLPNHRLLEILGLELEHRAVDNPTDGMLIGCARVAKTLWIANRAGDARSARTIEKMERIGLEFERARGREAEALAAAGSDDRTKGDILRRDQWSGRVLPSRKNMDQHLRVAELVTLIKGLCQTTGWRKRKFVRKEEGEPARVHNERGADAETLSELLAHMLVGATIDYLPQLDCFSVKPSGDFEADSAERLRRAEQRKRVEADLAVRLRRASKHTAEGLGTSGATRGPFAGIAEETLVRECLLALGVTRPAAENMIRGARKMRERMKSVPSPPE